jgi:hypothetical protein
MIQFSFSYKSCALNFIFELSQLVKQIAIYLESDFEAGFSDFAGDFSFGEPDLVPP